MLGGVASCHHTILDHCKTNQKKDIKPKSRLGNLCIHCVRRCLFEADWMHFSMFPTAASRVSIAFRLGLTIIVSCERARTKTPGTQLGSELGTDK